MNKKFILIEEKNYKVILRLTEKEVDYYTDVYIELITGGDHIELCRDNLLALKNVAKGYIIRDITLDKALDEKSLGLLLNKYYFYIEELETQKDIVLDSQGYWIGEKYCIFSERHYATWIYRNPGGIILKITPVFSGTWDENSEQTFNMLMQNYRDFFETKVSLQQLENARKRIIDLYEKYMTKVPETSG